MGGRIMALVVALGLAAGAAGADPVFRPDATLACLALADAADPARGSHAVLDCAGRAAQACMATPGGDSTLGTMDCLSAELTFWTDRMTAALAARTAAAIAADADPEPRRGAPDPLAPRLEAMQQAWETLRDAACRYEQAQWLGGSGGGPATLSCALQETARQALRLEGWWAP